MASMHKTWFVCAALVAMVAAGSSFVSACPFCSATAQTFSEEMATMDVAVIATLVDVPAAKNSDEIPKAKFEVARILKGDGLVKLKQPIETLYFGDGTKGKSFLIMGIDPPNIMWSTPLPLSTRAQDYLAKLPSLPKEGAQRLAFFQNYLEDEDEMLARDAYDEFAKAPYDAVKRLKDQLKHDQIVAWIRNPDIPASRRRLYFVMLGICGSQKDLPMLEEMIQSTDRKDRQGLDSLIACYLTLKGEAGLPLIEDSFLKNKKSDYADTYAAIMALRFHATEGGVIERKRVVDSLRLMLERAELADLVIPDLARWEDWSAMDRLFELYKTADEKTSWVRVPVVNYLRACPLPRAKELLKECEKIDPQAVKRANTFFPTPPSPVPEKSSQTETGGPKAPKFVSTSAVAPAAFEAPVPDVEPAALPAATATQPAASATAAPTAAAAAEEGNRIVASLNPGASPAKALKTVPTPAANLWQLLGVPILAGAALWLLQWSILRGRFGRG
jgi:hypothetical protein